MKKIFSILCAVAVAISLPFLTFVTSSTANADVIDTTYAPYQLGGTANEYVFNTNLSTLTDVYFMGFDNDQYIDYMSGKVGVTFSYFDSSLILLSLLGGITVTNDSFIGTQYTTGTMVQNESFMFYNMTLLYTAFSNNVINNVRLIAFAVPTVVPLSQSNGYGSQPNSIDDFYDMYVLMSNINNNIFITVGARYYAHAFYAYNGKLYPNVYKNRDNGYTAVLPYVGITSTVDDDFSYGVSSFDLTVGNDIAVNNYVSLGSMRSTNNYSFNITFYNQSFVPSMYAFNDFSYNGVVTENMFVSLLTSYINPFTIQVFDDVGGAYNNGYNAGYEYGRGVGDSLGFNRGYNEGYSNGKVDGLELSGIANIRAQEYNRGFLDGLARAESNGGSFGFISLLTTVADTQLALLTSFLDFNFLGWNMLTFFKSLLTICIVIMIIKFII